LVPEKIFGRLVPEKIFGRLVPEKIFGRWKMDGRTMTHLI